MTWLEKMDAVLLCLYKLSGNNPLFSDIEKWLSQNYPNQIDTGEIQDITLYLYREQMMYCEYNGDRTHPYVELIGARFLISCKGKLFWEGVGGFDEQNQNRINELNDISSRNERMEKNEENLVVWTKGLTNKTADLTFWTRLVAIGAIGLVVWEIVVYILDHRC